ncbi:uncharacterized protein N7515_009847 [Penicillium bovifimosum]|uniref:Uncharacterized protein n=1 Tax=Penicillium bovifimosum TaxID=126998 RepID=A0A9W9KUR0_9EURO|nr:uncharacterized protein N7515_009847 [Penicillium bovifimosum]KAJ5120459.1 hypothetical protein N7515_009847 [Penicillium bovifimosum]
MTYTRSARQGRSQWPPAPCVEDEPQSLSKELHGLSQLGDTPGATGVHRRGSIDQYPIIVSATPPPSSTSPASVPSVLGLGSVSSDDSSGPITPPAQEPIFRNTVRFETDGQPKHAPPSAASQPRGPSSRPVPQQQPTRELHAQRESHPPSHARGSDSYRQGPPRQNALHGSRGPSAPDRTAPRAPVHDQTYHLQPPRTSLGRSNSARHAPMSTRPMPERLRREPSSGYQSDSATTCNKPLSHQSKAPVPVVSVPEPLPSVPTLAERIEEKLRQRQEQRDQGSMSDPEMRETPSAVKPLNPAEPVNGNSTKISPSATARTSASHSPTRDYQHIPSPRMQREVPAVLRTRAASATAPPTRSMSESRHTSRPLRETSKPVSNQVTTQHNPHRTMSQPAHSRHADTSPQRQNYTGPALSPCPRTIAVAGYEDWYTLKGLDHLDICPSCMKQLANTRYRDYFIPSRPKPGEKIRCAFANAWTRLAWTQMTELKHDNLELLSQIALAPPGARPCPGRKPTEQPWYSIVDPDIGTHIRGFQICGSCARNVRILIPTHRDTFTQMPKPSTAVCHFVTSSPRFIKFMDLLSVCTPPDTRDFLNYVRRKAMLHDCARDRPVHSTWYYIPDLPQLCVCEDCYDEIVWPLKRSNYPIACEMRKMEPKREASCQLYSLRMRRIFLNAVDHNDFEMLKTVALQRFAAERRFLDRMRDLQVAQKQGLDCDELMRRAVAEWRKWE